MKKLKTKTMFRTALFRSLVLSMGVLFVGHLAAQTFTLTSKDVGGQATLEHVFNGFGCTGKNQSPQLSWSNAPAATKSFAITMYDPDAPTGSGWWHWTVFDMPPTALNIPAGAGDPASTLMPAGAKQGSTDFGSAGYGGPCPPPGHGLHQYIITVYALDVASLGLDGSASAPMVGFNIGQHVLAKASIVFYYGR